MANLDTVQVRALIDETDIGKIKPDMAVTTIVDAFPNRKFRGRVLRIGAEAIVEQNVTMFPVLVRIDNEQRLLRPGMNAEVEHWPFPMLLSSRSVNSSMWPGSLVSTAIPCSNSSEPTVAMNRIRGGARIRPRWRRVWHSAIRLAAEVTCRDDPGVADLRAAATDRADTREVAATVKPTTHSCSAVRTRYSRSAMAS